MLKIPKPPSQVSLKIKLAEATRKELEIYVKYLKSQQPHCNTDNVVEAIIQRVIPRVGTEAKKYREFKQNLG
jgi:uncharacterized protein YqeY